MIKLILFRLDSGANMFVANRLKYFSKLFRRKIGSELGTGVNSHFEGIGIDVVSSTEYPNKLIALYPTFFAPRDSTCTISNGALQRCAGFQQVVIDTGN